ncbi:MAG: vWA domain-containing protein [Alphaproteobacteria bacterium]
MSPLDETFALPSADGGGGRISANIMHFARVLRAAGLPIGPGRVLDAVRAARTVGVGDREDFYWSLHAVFVNRRDQRELFDQAFHIFWRNPQILEKMMSMTLSSIRVPPGEDDKEINRRLAEALRGDDTQGGDEDQERDEAEKEFDAVLTWSNQDVLRGMDFEKMSGEEVRRAKAVIANMRLPIMQVPTRRFYPDRSGHRIDMRATLRARLRAGGGNIPLARRKRRRRHPPLVILCDISGSMGRYSRMLLHFMHAVTNDRDRVHTFLFGTRLTNVTRHLRHRDVDESLERVGRAADDWSGGTHIGACLAEFIFHWSRRVLGQGALVLLITDGLDREGGDVLAAEMERLHKSCRRLIWLNPLLRYEGFEPKSMGMRAIMPHVDDFRTIHNLESLEDLADALSRPGSRREEGVSTWLKAMH